jgi:hypothetical protein
MKTLVKLLLILLITSCLFSCNGATDKDKCLQSVKHCFPHSIIYKDPDINYIFYVVDSSGMKKIATTNITNNNISNITEFIVVKP